MKNCQNISNDSTSLLNYFCSSDLRFNASNYLEASYCGWTWISSHLGPLHHDKLADLSLHEEDYVEQARGHHGGEYAPQWQLNLQYSMYVQYNTALINFITNSQIREPVYIDQRVARDLQAGGPANWQACRLAEQRTGRPADW